MDVSAIESPDLGEHLLEPLAHQHCHTLTSSSRRKERDIAALLIKQVRQRSVLDEIRARFRRIDLAEIQLVACRDAADLRFAPAQGKKPRIECRSVFPQNFCSVTLRIERDEQRLNLRAVGTQHLHQVCYRGKVGWTHVWAERIAKI